MRIVGGIVLVVLALFFGLHALPYLVTPDGRCMLVQQPNILLGSAPGLAVQLGCAASTPAPAPAPAAPQSAAPATTGQPTGIPASALISRGAVKVGSVYCLTGQPTAPGINGELENGSYVQLYGPAQGWFIDHDDPQNSPCKAILTP